MFSSLSFVCERSHRIAYEEIGTCGLPSGNLYPACNIGGRCYVRVVEFAGFSHSRLITAPGERGSCWGWEGFGDLVRVMAWKTCKRCPDRNSQPLEDSPPRRPQLALLRLCHLGSLRRCVVAGVVLVAVDPLSQLTRREQYGLGLAWIAMGSRSRWQANERHWRTACLRLDADNAVWVTCRDRLLHSVHYSGNKEIRHRSLQTLHSEIWFSGLQPWFSFSRISRITCFPPSPPREAAASAGDSFMLTQLMYLVSLDHCAALEVVPYI